jgi:hypothetical protein
VDQIPHTNLGRIEDWKPLQKNAPLIKPPPELIADAVCLEFADAVRPVKADTLVSPLDNDFPIILYLTPETKSLQFMNLSTRIVE